MNIDSDTAPLHHMAAGFSRNQSIASVRASIMAIQDRRPRRCSHRSASQLKTGFPQRDRGTGGEADRSRTPASMEDFPETRFSPAAQGNPVSERVSQQHIHYVTNRAGTRSEAVETGFQ